MTSIQVGVRVRPFNNRELKYESTNIIQMKGNNTTEIHQVKDGKIPSNLPLRVFIFDHCFWTHSSQDAAIPEIDNNTKYLTDLSVFSQKTQPIYSNQMFVYQQIGMPILDNSIQGFNACLFAYGQTGSGKTYSMMGSPSDPGVIPRLCTDLFGRIEKMKFENGTAVTVVCSYLEIYNESVRDLLNPATMDKALKVRQHPKLGVFVEGLTKLTVYSEEEISKLLNDGGSIRRVAATNMNMCSSRSHAILTLKISSKAIDGSELGSSLNLVDLAGSERAASSGAEGGTLKEGANINKSLTTLGMCLSRLADIAEGNGKGGHIPYRDSQLTWILNDSLGGNSKTAMLANISPASINFEETLSTLRFATTVKKIKNNATINEDMQQKLIRQLRAEIEEIKKKILIMEAAPCIDDGHSDNDEEEDEALLQLEALETAQKLFEEVNESVAQRAEREHIAKVEHEEAMKVFRSNRQGMFMDNSLPKLVVLNEDLHSFPSVALLYVLKDGVNRIGSGADRSSVLVRIPHRDGRTGKTVNLFHAIIDVDVVRKMATIRLCSEEEQPEGMEKVEEEDITSNPNTSRKASVTELEYSYGGVAPVYVNGVILNVGDTEVTLSHKDRIWIGPIALRHSQPASWIIDRSPLVDEEFSRVATSIEHCLMLEVHERLEIEISAQRDFGEALRNLSSGYDGENNGSEMKFSSIIHAVNVAIEDTVEALRELLFKAGESETLLVEIFPITDMIKQQNIIAAVSAGDSEYDFAFAMKERDDSLRRAVAERQALERDAQLRLLKEQERHGEEEIEKLREKLANKRKADEMNAEMNRREAEEHKAAIEKTLALRQLHHELQTYEEVCRVASMWKHNGPSPQFPADCEEYKLSQGNPTYGEICGNGDVALDLFPIEVYKIGQTRVLGIIRRGWHKVHLCIRNRFFYYFKHTTPTSEAMGSGYLYGCAIYTSPTPIEKQKYSLRIVPCVPRSRNKCTKRETNDNDVLFAFDDFEMLENVKDIIEGIRKPVPPPAVAKYYSELEKDREAGDVDLLMKNIVDND